MRRKVWQGVREMGVKAPLESKNARPGDDIVDLYLCRCRRSGVPESRVMLPSGPRISLENLVEVE
jgi:hypothetical protein